MKILLAGILTTFAAASACALPGALSLNDELTLTQAHPPIEVLTETSTELTFLDDDRLVTLRDTPTLDAEQAPELPSSATDIRGMNYADLRNEVKAVAYRTPRGLGLGLASTGGVAFSGGYATESGMRINLYYIRSFSELTNEASRATGIDLTNQPSRSVGITLGWKF